MKKQLIIATLLALLFLGVSLIVKYNSKPKYQNIFDGIYFGEESIFHIPYGYSSFSKIPGTHDIPARKDYEFDGSVFERYTDNTTIDSLSWSTWFFSIFRKLYFQYLIQVIYKKIRIFISFMTILKIKIF